MASIEAGEPAGGTDIGVGGAGGFEQGLGVVWPVLVEEPAGEFFLGLGAVADGTECVEGVDPGAAE